jgi:hypothetical protein
METQLRMCTCGFMDVHMQTYIRRDSFSLRYVLLLLMRRSICNCRHCLTCENACAFDICIVFCLFYKYTDRTLLLVHIILMTIVYMYVYIFNILYVYVPQNVKYTHTCKHEHTHAHTDTHTYTHTYTCHAYMVSINEHIQSFPENIHTLINTHTYMYLPR